MDTVFIQGLRLRARIGIYAWEKQQPQNIVLDIDMAADCRPAAHSDDIADALDYKKVVDRVSELVQGNKHLLVETLAEQVANCVMQEFSVPGVRVRVSKPDAIGDALGVGVFIRRGSDF